MRAKLLVLMFAVTVLALASQPAAKASVFCPAYTCFDAGQACVNNGGAPIPWEQHRDLLHLADSRHLPNGDHVLLLLEHQYDPRPGLLLGVDAKTFRLLLAAGPPVNPLPV